MSTESVVLMAAGIGAGGAIAGQLVTSIFTARREREKLRFEEQRHFGDVRREAFAQFLRMAAILRDEIALVEVTVEPDLESARIRLTERGDPLIDKMRDLQVDIRLLAPEVNTYAYELLHYTVQWRDRVLRYNAGSGESGLGESFMRLTGCEQAMRGNLGVPFKTPKVAPGGPRQVARQFFRRS